MAYTFGDIERQANTSSGARGPIRTDSKRLGVAQGPTTPQQAGLKPASIRIKPEKQLLYGEDVWSNQPPAVYRKGSARGPVVELPSASGHRLILDEGVLAKHLLLLGGIGSGKTNVFNFILSSLLSHQSPQDIVFIFDTKGDFYERFYDVRNPHHVVIGNAPVYASRTRYWNVFSEIEEADGSFGREGMFAAKEIGKQLFAGMESENTPFFSLAAADLVSKLLIDFERRAAASGNRSELNNSSFANWISSADLGAYSQMVLRNPDFASAQLYFGDPHQGNSQRLTAQALGVFALINLMRNDFLHGIFASHVPGREFSMRGLVRNRGKDGGRTVVFVEYDLATGEVLAPMYRLLFDLAMKEALGQGRRRDGNVFFVIDEFKLLPDLMHIDDALNFGRSLGVKVLAGLQSINQVFDIYGEDRGRAMLSGFMNAMCFQASDSNTRQYVCERFGENRYQLVYRENGQYRSVQAEGHAIEDWDVRSLPVGTAAIDLVGSQPFIYRFAEYTG